MVLKISVLGLGYVGTDIEIAEMVKYADNAWHALKVGFANEIGNVCKALEVDAHRVMDIFCQDTKLNLSPSYLKPGFAFGGSCLPKDLRALLYKAKTLDVSAPILGAILPSNEQQIERGVQAVIEKGSKKVGILGFSFKAGTDDLRESPIVELAERLIGKGYDLRMYDSNVRLAAIHGANRDGCAYDRLSFDLLAPEHRELSADFRSKALVSARCVRRRWEPSDAR